MKDVNLKEILVQNGIEDQKKAAKIINWHEIFGFVLVVVVCNIIDAIIDVEFGLLILILAIINAFLWRKYVEKNASNTNKLLKSYKMVKIGTFALILLLVVVFSILIATHKLY